GTPVQQGDRRAARPGREGQRRPQSPVQMPRQGRTESLANRYHSPRVPRVLPHRTTTPPQNDHSECRMSCRENLNRLEESLTFILARCAERGHQFLVGQLAALIRDPEYRVVERHMVFVHDADAWKN